MILDSSAIVAILLREEGYRPLAEAITEVETVAIGAPTLVEADMVMVGRFDLHGSALVAQFLLENDVVVVPFDERHRSVAFEAFARYGKGRHPAALNYGDCMTYATANMADQPLLFTGDDFAKTDLVSAL